MRRMGGIACLLACFWLAVLVMFPGTAGAADYQGFWGASSSLWSRLITPAQAQTPLEAQMLGEKPFKAQPPALPSLESLPGLESTPGGATLRFHRDVELRVSFLYDGDRTEFRPDRPFQSYVLFRYSMDYRLLPNLRVGLSGYLYHPLTSPGIQARHPWRDAMGLGPALRYDLGRWSFIVKGQVVSGEQPRSESLESWFRVWYSF